MAQPALARLHLLKHVLSYMPLLQTSWESMTAMLHVFRTGSDTTFAWERRFLQQSGRVQLRSRTSQTASPRARAKAK